MEYDGTIVVDDSFHRQIWASALAVSVTIAVNHRYFESFFTTGGELVALYTKRPFMMLK